MGRRKNLAESIAFRRRLLRCGLYVILAITALDSFRTTVLSSHEVQSVSMLPTFAPGDRILATPLFFGPRTVFGKLPGLAEPRRSDVVLATPPGTFVVPSFSIRLADTIVRLVSFQKVSLLRSGARKGESSLIMKRVIALPGDTILMENGKYRIMTSDSGIFRSEAEVLGRTRIMESEVILPGWLPGLPGSGTMAPRTLGPGEYFLAGDARTRSADSRQWGPIRSESLVALVLFRYWPLSHSEIR